MSISGSLSNALSGLTATSRAAEVVSSNVANALTDGYGRREIDLASRTTGRDGAGVEVVGVRRSIDELAISQRRLADAALGQSSGVSEFLAQFETALGLPDDPGSLSGRVAQFDAALIEAASRPDSDARLSAVLSAAINLSDNFNEISDRVQSLRLLADKEINLQVGALNDGLSKVEKLNNDIRIHMAAGHDANALLDSRQRIIDGISSIVPLRQVPRDYGQIALFTPGGAILLDGVAAKLGFSPVGTIVPQMSIGTGALSGLTINGQTISSDANGPLGGGSLAGHFEVRDQHAVLAQVRLDAAARDLIERFATPTVDPTISPTDPGLFTDSGLPFNAATEIGVSSRLRINALVDPQSGGAIWRIRDGLGAVAQGDVGDATLIQGLSDALHLAKVPASGGFTGVARSASGLIGDLLSLSNSELLSAQSEEGFALGKLDILKALELNSGVDSDYEMQQLLLIEHAYSANARVISTIDHMMQTILGI